MPIHPATVHLPIGMLLGASSAELLGVFVDNTVVSNGALVMLIGGLATGCLSAMTGFYELWRLRRTMSQTAEAVVDRHLQLMTLVLTIYGAALFLHLTERPVSTAATAAIGAVTLTVGGHLGGKLVYQHRLGIDDTDTRPGLVDS